MAESGINWRDAPFLNNPIAAGTYGSIAAANALGLTNGFGHRKVAGEMIPKSTVDLGAIFDEVNAAIESIGASQQDAIRARRRAAAGRREDQWNSELEAMIAAIRPPSLEDYVGGYDAAEATARDAASAARPVINGQINSLLQALGRYGAEGRGDARQASRETARAGRTATNEARGLSQSILSDLQRQSGSDVASSLVSGAAAEAAVQEQGIRENFRAEQALNRDLTRNEQGSIRDQRGGAQQVRAAALADATNNLDSILGQLGIERAGATGAFNQAMAEYEQQIAQMRIAGRQEFRQSEEERRASRRQARAESASQYQEQALAVRQATGEASTDVIDQLAVAVENGQDPNAALQLIAETYGPSWADGTNATGMQLDVDRIIADAQRYIDSIMGQQEPQ